MDNMETNMETNMDMTIANLVNDKIDDGITPQELGDLLGVSYAMISRYKTDDNGASLEVARKIYKNYMVVIYPYSLKAVQDGRTE